MVPNGDFEYFTSCPSSVSSTTLAPPWRQYHVATSDYFNACAVGFPTNVPFTAFGYQHAASGNGFMGAYAYATSYTSWNEYIAAPITPLTIGHKYEVSVSVNLSNNSASACNGIGVYFYDNGPTTTITTSSSVLPVTPQISYNGYGVISDTQNWVRLVDTFTADSAYDNIVIGKFTPPGGLTVIGNGLFAYYYYDSVVVRYMSGIYNNLSDSLFCAGDTFLVPYTVNNNFTTFNSGNQFLVQLSNSSGNFSGGTTIIGTRSATTGGNIQCIIPSSITPGGVYKIRILSTNNPDTSNITAQNIAIGISRPNKPTATGSSPICSGKSINLLATTTTNGVTYKWTGPNNYTSYTQNPIIPISAVVNSGAYIVSARSFGCQSKDTINISVIQSPYPLTANNDTSICQNKQMQLSAYSPYLGVSYNWMGPNNYSSSNAVNLLSNLQQVNAGYYIVQATLNSCLVLDTVQLNIKPNPAKPLAYVNTPVCPSGTASFVASTSTQNTTWYWSGPNNFSSTMQSPLLNNVQVNCAGSYVVTSTLQGCSNTDTIALAVIAKNGGLFTSSNSPVCENDTIKVFNTAANATSYSWTGPNGFSSNAKDTIITPATMARAGEYRFTAVYPGCTYYDTLIVNITQHASGRLFSSNSPVCAGDTLRLAASTTSTNVNYTWTGPNSYVATTQNPSIINVNSSQAGKYYVNFILNGCIAKDSINVVVNPTPNAITASANAPICQNDTLKLSSTNSSSGVTWQWSGPAGYTSLVKDTFLSNAQTTASGDYIVTATNSFNCKAKDTVTVLVKPLPANLNATTNAPICAGSTLTLNSTTTSSGVAFSWVGPGAYTSTLQSPSIINAQPTATGSYIVTAMLNGCSVKDTVVAIINALPPAPTPSANTPVCVGQDLTLNASIVSGATYQWTSTVGFSSTSQNPIIAGATTTAAGKYYVRSLVNGCYSPYDSVTVAVIPAPVINMYPSPKDSICQGNNITFVSNNSNAGTTYTRTWFKNNNVIGGAANANYSTTTAADKDEYFVTLTAYGVCATPYTDTSNKIIVHVLPWLAPAVSITANPTTTVPSGTMINFTATPVNGGTKPTYQWTRNGANVVGALSNIWGASTLSNNDQICVDMTSSYMCPNPKSAKSNCIKVSIESTGIAHTWTGNEPKIYPNPVKDILVIEGVEKGTKIQLKDVIGRTIIDQTSIGETTNLNTASLVPGSYMLLLYTQNGNSMVVKIVKD